MRIEAGPDTVDIDGWTLHLDRRYDPGLLRILTTAARTAGLTPADICAADITIGEHTRARHVVFEIVRRPDLEHDLVTVDLDDVDPRFF